MIGCRIIGLPLHMTSITGIIIALGLLIDNGIIVVEDYKYRRGIGLTTNESISQTLTQLIVFDLFSGQIRSAVITIPFQKSFKFV